MILCFFFFSFLGGTSIVLLLYLRYMRFFVFLVPSSCFLYSAYRRIISSSSFSLFELFKISFSDSFKIASAILSILLSCHLGLGSSLFISLVFSITVYFFFCVIS